jgi:hypothetical protein
MTRRDVFPREADRVILDRFLAGDAKQDALDHLTVGVGVGVGCGCGCGCGWASQIDWLTTKGSRLRIVADMDWLWYDERGNLCAMIGLDVAMGTTVRGINYLCELLDIPDRVERERSTNIKELTRFTFGGCYVDVGSPFIVAGHMTVLAWRASVKGTSHG